VYSVVTLPERPDFLEPITTISKSLWVPKLPPSRSAPLYPRIIQEFAENILIIFDDVSDEPVGYAGALTFVGPADLADLPDDGYDALIEQAFEARDHHLTPTLFGATVIGIRLDRRGQGLSEILAKALCDRARQGGFSDLVIPVRPTQKADEPLTPMADYVQKRRGDGLPQDPWIRLHARLGARIIKVCPTSMTLRAPVADWEAATGMRFDQSGPYAVPGGLAPLHVDLERGEGLLLEPNVWMHYDLR
jgi:hypothetical protein